MEEKILEEETSEQETGEEVEEETSELETGEDVEEETSELETREENVDYVDTSTTQNIVVISQDVQDVLISIDTGIEFLNGLTLTLIFIMVVHIIIGCFKSLFNKSIL